MTIFASIGGLVRPALLGRPVVPTTAVIEMQAWRVRPFPGAKSALSGRYPTDAPKTHPHVSASERCP